MRIQRFIVSLPFGQERFLYRFFPRFAFTFIVIRLGSEVACRSLRINVTENVRVFGDNGNRVNCALHCFFQVRLEFVDRCFRFVGHKAATRKLMQAGADCRHFRTAPSPN